MTIIQSDGFILRPISFDDLHRYWECMQDEETKKGFMSVPQTIDEAKAEIREYGNKTNQGITEVFTVEVDGDYAGNVKLDWQNWDKNSGEGRIHLWIHPAFRGKGLATRALKVLVRHGFEDKGMHIIYTQCKKANHAVCKVIENVGFRKVEDRLVEGIEKVWWEMKRGE